MSQPVTVTLNGPQGLITIDRPKVLNALNLEVLTQMGQALDRLLAEPQVRVIVITGGGDKAFVSGADIDAMLAMNGLDSCRWSETGNRLFAAIENAPKPVLAAVNGYAFGGGFELVLACDFCICTENSVFGAPEANLGVICGFGGTVRLPRKIGPLRAKELLMTGRRVKAREAYELGLVNRLAPAGALWPAVDEFCAELTNKNSITLDILKKMVNYGLEADKATAIQLEASLFGLISGTEDKFEGMGAFREKRPPVWKNR